MFADTVSTVTIWLTTSTGWELAIDVRERDVESALGRLIAVGTPSHRPRPRHLASPPAGTTSERVPAPEDVGVTAPSLTEVLDMDHAHKLAGTLGASKQTQCVAILAYEAERAGLQYLPRVGSKNAVVDLLGKPVGSTDRAILANTVTPSGMVSWADGREGVQLADPGRQFLAPALSGDGKEGATT